MKGDPLENNEDFIRVPVNAKDTIRIIGGMVRCILSFATDITRPIGGEKESVTKEQMYKVTETVQGTR